MNFILEKHNIFINSCLCVSFQSKPTNRNNNRSSNNQKEKTNEEQSTSFADKIDRIVAHKNVNKAISYEVKYKGRKSFEWICAEIFHHNNAHKLVLDYYKNRSCEKCEEK